MRKILEKTCVIFIISVLFIMSKPLFVSAANTTNDTEPTIAYARIDTSGKLTIHITDMNQIPEILINDKKVNAKLVGTSTFEVVNKELINTTAKITLKNKNQLISKTFYLAAGKEFEDVTSVGDMITIKDVFTDGKNAYMYCPYQHLINKLDLDMYGSSREIGYMSLEDIEEMFDNKYKLSAGYEYYVDNTDFVFINGVIYSIYTFNFGKGLEYVLVGMNTKCEPEAPVWKRIADIPDECKVSKSTLGVYNGNLYVIGGYNEKTNTISKSVYEYNLKSKKWIKKDNLPGVRFAATANQVGNKLILSFGGKSDGTIPCNLIYDGKSWTKSKASINVKTSTGKIKDKKYYKPSVGIVSGGLIYSGINAEKIGNTFYYDIATDTFKSSGYKANVNTVGVAVGNKYYIFDKTEKNAKFTVRAISVRSGLSKLTVRYPETGIRAWVNSDLYAKKKSNDVVYNTYYYMPGDVVGFKLSDVPGYYYNHFKVDGKEVNGYLYKGSIGASKEIRITKAEITSLIKLNRTYGELSLFNTLQLKATISNTNCTPMKWKSNNTSYAKVSENGLVTPRAAGLDNGLTATGTTTLNGRNISVQSKIKIVLPDVNNLRIIDKTKTSVKLVWNQVKGADGYEIHIFNQNTHEYIIYKRTNSNTISIPNLDSKYSYSFGVKAYKKIEGYEFETYMEYV